MPLKVKFEACSSAELTRLHEASLHLLEETGLIFHEPEAVEIFKKHGANVDGEKVFISPKMVEAALKSCPSSYQWQALNEKKSKLVGDGPLLGAMVSAISILDIENRLRPSTLDDVRKVIQSHQASDVMSFVTSMVVEANDVNPDYRHLYVTYETLKNCDKPFCAYNILPHGQRAVELLDMVEIAFGPLGESKRVTLLSATPASPLKFEQNTLQAMIEFAKRSQPVAISPCALSGVSCPIDLIGGSLLQNVEILAGLVLLQLINPGTAVVYHVGNINTNFKAVTAAWGSPEFMLMCMPNLQLASEMYHLPTRVNSGVTTAKAVDYMAAIETTQSMFMSVLAGTNLVYCSCGTLENLKSYSYEKQILDEEIFSRAKRVYDGVEFSEEALSIEVIKEIGHGGNYLKHPSTLRKFRNPWSPSVSNYDLSDDSKADVLKNANNIWKERVASAPESLINSDLDKDLQKYIKKTLNLA